MSIPNEVFRFATVRGIQRASDESLKGRTILCCDTADDFITPAHMPLPSAVLTREEAVAAARAFFDSDQMLKKLSCLETPIAHLDNWLLDRGDTPHPERVRDEILSQGIFTTLEELITDANYRNDRRRVSASLAAALLLPDGNERLQTMLIRAMYIFGLIEELSRADTVVKLPADVFYFLAFATIILPKGFTVPAESLSRPPSIADLKLVKQEVIRYEMGDIAHIENVLKNEIKSRVHRRKDTREETLITERERETSEERELQTTERFEMQQETSSVIKDDMHFEAGATITASYGPTVSATVSAGFEMNHAEEESKRTATNFAREVMERTANRIRERIRSQRIVKTINEVEETNTHGIDNKGGKDHIVGIYRYVDKVYKAQVYSYGKRLLLEFIVPEPASFVKQLLKKPLSVDMQAPEIPQVGETGEPKRALKPTDISRTNYLDWAAKYFVQDVVPPPMESIWRPLAWEEKATPDTGLSPGSPARKIYKVDQSLEVPPGYLAKHIQGIIGVSDYSINIMLAVGNTSLGLTQVYQGDPNGTFSMGYSFDTPLLTSPTGKVPVGLVIENCWGYQITLLVRCDLLAEGFQKWQLETYSQIMRAYFELKSMYDQKVAAAQIQQGVAIEGRNPNENRKTERTELKKHVIAMLGKNYFTQAPVDREAIKTVSPENYPEIDFDVAHDERNYIQWFEQAFEWQNMTHVFYPYYWGKKSDWKDEALKQDPDPMFNAFLRAGAARVVVPVRPRFEKAMGLYLATGIIWNGNQAPQVGDPLFVSAIQEIQEQQDASQEGTPEGKSWEFTLPTPLVILQEKGAL